MPIVDIAAHVSSTHACSPWCLDVRSAAAESEQHSQRFALTQTLVRCCLDYKLCGLLVTCLLRKLISSGVCVRHEALQVSQKLATVMLA